MISLRQILLGTYHTPLQLVCHKCASLYSERRTVTREAPSVPNTTGASASAGSTAYRHALIILHRHPNVRIVSVSVKEECEVDALARAGRVRALKLGGYAPVSTAPGSPQSPVTT